MAVKISVTVPMEAKIRKLLQSVPVMEAHGGTIRQLVALIDDAHDKKTRKSEQHGGLGPTEVIHAVKAILGSKISVPPNPGAAFYGFVKKRTKFLNVSLEDIERAAVHVRTGSAVFKLPNSMEWFIRRLDAIMNEAEEAANRPEEESEWQLVTGREDV